MFVLLCSYLILIFSSVSCEECTRVNDCSCKTSNGTVDLSKSKNEFTIHDEKTKYTYKFKPCEIVSECKVSGSTDIQTVCQIPDGSTTGYDLGDSNTAKFSGNPETNNLVLKYTTSFRTTLINIHCVKNEEGKLVSVNENPQNLYTFELQTRHACFGAEPTPKPEPEPGKHNISTGSVLLIIFFVFLGVYFIAGMVFLKFARGAQGTEMIPNYDFWTSLPGYIKDGVLFTCRGCKAQSSYSKI